VPYPPGGENSNGRTPAPVNVARVGGAEWNVDGGGFAGVPGAYDGAWDEESELYQFTTSPLSNGTHTVGTRSINSFGHVSQTATDILTVNDADGDGAVDAQDNCPTVANPAQTNTDEALAAAGATVSGDSTGDACDADDDNDGFSDGVETAIGTNPLDNCRGDPGSGGDAWPLDNNVDGAVNVVDIMPYRGKIPGAVDATHPKRLDLDNNNFLNILDVIKYQGKIPTICS